jgi:hypothetical protein
MLLIEIFLIWKNGKPSLDTSSSSHSFSRTDLEFGPHKPIPAKADVFAVIYFNSSFVFAYIFGLFYIIEIFLLTILNSLKVKFGFVLRVKYPYYFLFLICAFLHSDYITWFHAIFGIYYLMHSLFLYSKLINHFKDVKE